MRKPVIGITPLWDEGKNSIWMVPGYMDGIIKAGGCPVILPLTAEDGQIEQLVEELDGFLFTGGHDISPAFYNETAAAECGPQARMRDELEEKLFSLLMRQDKPVFGICRGIQLINALLGGSLYQDIPSKYATNLQHVQTPPYDIPIHSVWVLDNTPLKELLKTDEIWVNSYHHQAISVLSPRLTAMAVSPDGLTEAVYMPERRFVWAVQWHPEFCTEDGASIQLFQAFLDACRTTGA